MPRRTDILTPSPRRRTVALIVSVAIGLASCTASDKRERWSLSGDGQIAFKPICADYRAPSLGKTVPAEGLVPAFLFNVDGASAEEVTKLRQDLLANGFSVAAGTVTINRTKIVFAAGEGVLKTQPMADRLYQAMCGLEQEQVRLVHARYNEMTEAERMI